MTLEESIKYCENHECSDCIIYQKKLDKRSEQEIKQGVLCAENLINLKIKKS